MHFIKRYIKPISIAVISTGAAISVAGLITMTVAGTHSVNVVNLSTNITELNKTPAKSVIGSAGWLNYDANYWTNNDTLKNPNTIDPNTGQSLIKTDNFGKAIDLTFSEFLAYYNHPTTIAINKGIINMAKSSIELGKSSGALTSIGVENMNMKIQEIEAFLNIQSQFSGAIAGCVLLPAGIVIAFAIMAALIIFQKKLPHTDDEVNTIDKPLVTEQKI